MIVFDLVIVHVYGNTVVKTFNIGKSVLGFDFEKLKHTRLIIYIAKYDSYDISFILYPIDILFTYIFLAF